MSTCWRCHDDTPIVSYDFTFRYDHLIGAVPRLDELLMREYSFVKRVFNKPQSKTVAANVCVNCGAHQSNWYTHQALLELKATEQHPVVDTTLPNELNLEDFPFYDKVLPYKQRLPIAQIQYLDGNKANYNSDNLLLVCNDCINR